jgi:anaerobic selenocysteine-containing dehydrogenase
MIPKTVSNITERFGTCSKDCYGSCVYIRLWNDYAKELNFQRAKPQISHPFTRGFFCSKLNERKNLLYHPQRLKHCLIRVKKKGNNEFNSIKNTSAFEIIVKKIKEINNTYGSDAIVGAFNAGNCGLISRYAPLRFFKKLGATITTGGICNEGGCAGLTHLFGTYSITNPMQILNPETKLIVVWGSNISERNNHAYALIKEAQNKGVKLIVLDSQRTVIAKQADLFIPTIPGMDHIIALIISKYILQNRLYDSEFLDKYTDFDNDLYTKIVQLNEVEFIDSLGLNLEQIFHFINLLKKYQGHTIFNIGFGVQKDIKGGNIVQLIALIQILLGNISKPGTGIIYSQSDFIKETLKPLIKYITAISLKASVPQVSLINLGKELQKKQYKMIFIYNFNPLSSLPNLNLVRKSFTRNDLFVVVQELFLNETTKYADIVIPSKFDLESYDLITPYYIPGISMNQAGPCPYPNCLSNFEFYKSISEMMGWEDSELREDDEAILNNCLNLLPTHFKKGLLSNGYNLLFNREDIPFKDKSFPTINNKINLSGLNINFGFDRVNQIRNRNKNTFFLITPPHEFHIHSQLGQINKNFSDSFKKVYISKEDMQSLDLEEGLKVLVSNQYGKGEFTVAISPSLSKGTALIYSGSPFDFKGRVNPNIYTSDIPEEMGASGAYNSAIIEIAILHEK